MQEIQFQEETELKIPCKIRRLRSFEGKSINNIVMLLNGTNEKGKIVDVKRNLVTPKFLLNERVYGKNYHDRILLQDKNIDTACGVVVDPEGSGEVVLGLYSDPIVKELINSLNPNSDLKNNSLVISRDYYQAIKKNGFVFSPDIANNLRANAYSENKARQAAWEYVIEGESKLFKDYVKLVIEKLNEIYRSAFILPNKYDSNTNCLGWSLSQDSGLKLLGVGSIIHCFSSDANSHDLGELNSIISRIIGIAYDDYDSQNVQVLKPHITYIDPSY
tara:strand:+ start:992 stop:1816 length:825 start_codon:yes stop_codon:yes gene_type:complete